MQDAQSPEASDFQTELAAYMLALKLDKVASKYAQDMLKDHDFSSARAALVPSLPGAHTGARVSAYSKQGSASHACCSAQVAVQAQQLIAYPAKQGPDPDGGW